MQIGYSYGSLLESTYTGYLLHCKGWRSVYLYPERPCFLGCTSVNLNDALVQQMKWSSGLFQAGVSKYSPLTYGLSKMSFLQSMCYGYFMLSPFASVAMLLYSILPPLYFFAGIPLFPKVRKFNSHNSLILLNFLLNTDQEVRAKFYLKIIVVWSPIYIAVL